MPLALKIRKSSGVSVTPAVHRLLKTANAARDGADWPTAAEAYRAALDQAPDLTHIWIQLGHVLKEGGDPEAAREAYETAARLTPDDPDPGLHLGHLAKTQGDVAGAARAYLTSAALNADGDATAELRHMVTGHAPAPPGVFEAWLSGSSQAGPPALDVAAQAREAVAALVTALKRAPGHDPDALAQAQSAADLIATLDTGVQTMTEDGAVSPCLVFDVSDLFTYFRNVRSPTGIQRVQIEIITNALAAGVSARICCFIEARDEWVEIPERIFTRLCALSLDGNEGESAEWTVALNGALMTLSIAPPMAFPRGAFLINLGTSWWLQNYFLQIRCIKQKHQVRYVPFVHDMIPVLHGEFCPKALTQDFISWAIGVFEHADFFFVNSESTKRDLLRVGAFLGREVEPDLVSVVRLDADIRKPGRVAAKTDLLRRFGLDGSPFVLFVSTIEPRKNHLRVFEAWLALLKKHGPRRTPKLVCIGHPGWLNDAIHEQLTAHEALASHVHRFMFVSDQELAQFYERCLFSLYPSFYEGWGLPVTESLCHGKTALVANSSSLPEAGGPFAAYFDPNSTPELIAGLETLMFDPAARAERERRIAAEFRPRAWSELAEQMAGDVEAWADLPPSTWRPIAAPEVGLGAYHAFGRNRSTRIWPAMRSGEVYRDGANWWGPDDWGCWTKPGGSALRLSVPVQRRLRLHLHIRGLPATTCPYTVGFADQTAQGELRPAEEKWLALDVPAEAVEDGLLALTLRGEASEDLRGCTDGSDQRVVSFGVNGFFVCEADDAAARLAFIEAVALGNLPDILHGREPAAYASLAQ
jgi:glycosyltransferase involved in cell wall biosynthesis